MLSDNQLTKFRRFRDKLKGSDGYRCWCEAVRGSLSTTVKLLVSSCVRWLRQLCNRPIYSGWTHELRIDERCFSRHFPCSAGPIRSGCCEDDFRVLHHSCDLPNWCGRGIVSPFRTRFSFEVALLLNSVSSISAHRWRKGDVSVQPPGFDRVSTEPKTSSRSGKRWTPKQVSSGEFPNPFDRIESRRAVPLNSVSSITIFEVRFLMSQACRCAIRSAIDGLVRGHSFAGQ
jgi:hypothetical protein